MGRRIYWDHPFFLILLSQFCVAMGMSLVNPILPLYASTFNISYTLVGLVISSFGISRIFLEIPGGIFSDRFGRKPIILFGYALSIVSHLVAGFAQTHIELIISRMLIGSGSALFLTAGMTYVIEIAPQDRASRYLALYQSTFSIASIICPILSGLVSEHLGFRPIFLSSATITLVGILLVLIMKPPENRSTSEEPVHRRRLNVLEIVKDIRTITISVSCFMVFFLYNSVSGTMIPLYGTTELNLNSLQIGLIFSFTSIIVVLGLLFIIHRLERVIKRSLLLTLSLFICSISVFLISFASDFGTLILFSLPLGIGLSILQPISFILVNDYANPESKGLTMGLSRTIADFGIIFGPILVGWLIDLGNPLLFFYLVTVILSLFALFTYIIFRKPR